MHTLFKLDDKFPLYIGKHNNRVFMFFEPSDTELKSMLECWHNKQTELKNGEISPEEYDLWKYGFGAVLDGYKETNAWAFVLASTAFCYQNARLLVAMPLIPRRTAKRKEVISNG